MRLKWEKPPATRLDKLLHDVIVSVSAWQTAGRTLAEWENLLAMPRFTEELYHLARRDFDLLLSFLCDIAETIREPSEITVFTPLSDAVPEQLTELAFGKQIALAMGARLLLKYPAEAN